MELKKKENATKTLNDYFYLHVILLGKTAFIVFKLSIE